LVSIPCSVAREGQTETVCGAGRFLSPRSKLLLPLFHLAVLLVYSTS